MDIYIRTDANQEVATGHVTRCIAIARELLKLGKDVCFIVSDETSAELVRAKNFSVCVLNSKYNDMDSEISEIKKLVDKQSVNLILVDSYFATERYLEAIMDMKVSLAIIDDFAEKAIPCNIIINYTIYADEEFYKKKYSERKYILGTKCVPLREEFNNLPSKKIKKRAENILVICGGTDPCHFILNFFKELIAEEEFILNINLCLVCGRFNEDYDKIVELKKECENIKIIKHTDKLHEYMLEADIAISAGGTSLYELSACGTPTLSYSMADNQLKNVKAFEKKGIIEYIGDVREKGFDFSKVILKVRRLSDNKSLREIISRKMQNLVDGKGAERIAKELLEKLSFDKRIK